MFRVIASISLITLLAACVDDPSLLEPAGGGAAADVAGDERETLPEDVKPVSSALSTGSNLWTNGVVHWTPDAQDYPQLGTGSFTLADLETNTVVVS